MSALRVRLFNGTAVYGDANHDLLYGKGWHFSDDEGQYVATLPLPRNVPDGALQQCLYALYDQYDAGWNAALKHKAPYLAECEYQR